MLSILISSVVLTQQSVPARDLAPLHKLSTMIGGVWRGEIKTPTAPLKVEFVYKRHIDGEGLLGEGVVGKGSAKPMYIHSQFGWDPIGKQVYYLDSHDSNTVYWGHVAVQKEDVTFTFGPAGGDSKAFSSVARFLDKDTMQSIIKNSKGEEQVGFTLKRYRK